MSSKLPSYRFRPSERIKLQREADCIFQKGGRFSDGFLTLLWLDQTSQANLGDIRRVRAGRRFAAQVSRKVGNAVCRNRVKRMLREIFRHEKEHLKSGIDLIVMVRTPPPIQKAIHMTDLKRRFLLLCQKSKILKE